MLLADAVLIEQSFSAGTKHNHCTLLMGALCKHVTRMSAALQEFDDSGGGNPFLAVWGQAVLILYYTVVSILIMSLLVAVITHAYNPESVNAHSLVMQAESTFHYDFHGEQSACRL
jgi:hypothetical protein